MQAGSDVYKVVTGKRDIIFIALYKAVLETRTKLKEAQRRLDCSENYTPSGKKRNDEAHIQILEERLEHYAELKEALLRTHWRKLWATDFSDWVEDLLEYVLGWQYDYDARLSSGQQITIYPWDDAWRTVRQSARQAFKNLIRLALTLERDGWEEAPRPQKQPRPLEYRPQISPNAPAL